MRKWLGLLILGAALTASASPFIGAGLDWGWPYIEAGWQGLSFTGWVKKYEPNLAHWYSLGLEGKVPLFFENFFIGGGPRVSLFVNDSWGLASWHWGLYAVVEWVYRPLTIFLGVYAPIQAQMAEGLSIGPIPPTWPFNDNDKDDDVKLFFGFRYLLWCGGPGESPCPYPSQ